LFLAQKSLRPGKHRLAQGHSAAKRDHRKATTDFTEGMANLESFQGIREIHEIRGEKSSQKLCKIRRRRELAEVLPPSTSDRCLRSLQMKNKICIPTKTW
jgi:hypothetical protein